MHHDKFVIPIHIFGLDLSITKYVMLMFGVTITIVTLLSIANRSRRFRLIELFLFNFISDAFASSLHRKKTRIWFTFLMALFLFVFLNNLCGLLPGGSSPTGKLSIAGALAIMVFIVAQLTGVMIHGFHHAKNLIPAGIPKPMLIFFIPLEIVSQLARPFSLAVRLFANMFAGHQVLLIFLALATTAPAVIKALPFGGVVIISLFEMFVSFIQAFIFTYLASFYISEAANGEH